MRIGMCADMYMPHVSGVTNHIRLYKRHFEELGHEVYLFTFGDTDYPDDEPHVIRTHGVPWGDTGWNFAPAYSRESRALLATMDVLHVHHPFQSGRLAAPLAQRAGIPLVFTNHTRYDLYSDAYAALVPRGPRYATLRRMLNGFLARCDRVIAPSESIRSWLHLFAECDNVTTIPNGIDIDFFAHPTVPLTRADLGLTEQDFVFLYLGRVAPEKNTDYLFDEFFAVAAEQPTARLLVVGGGPELEAARAMAAAHPLGNRIVFTGMQPYPALPSFTALADAFVTSSVSEVHPLVVLEAMAGGLPIVAVSSPGISDTVQQGMSGLLAKTPDAGLLAREMTEIAGKPSVQTRLAAGAVKRAEEYSFAHTADRVLALYEELIAARC